jgi:hypothetical protein
VGRIEEIMEASGIGIREVNLQRDLVEKKLQMTIIATCDRTTDVEALSHSLSRFAEVEKVEID